MSWTKHAKHTLGLLAACAAWGPYGGALGHAEPPEQDPPGMREAQQDPADAQPEYVPGELLVKFRDDPPHAAIALAAQLLVGAEELKAFPAIGVRLWRLDPRVTVEQALEIISRPAFADAVDFAEPNYIVHAFDVPNDPRFGEQWALHNTGQTGGTPGADIAAPDAWGIQTGSPSIVVGVIDTGIDYNHEDLAANIWINPGEIAGNGIDDDGNGFIDDARGWDFVNDDNDPMDDNNHGTHTSGTVGAVGNNGIGVVGVNWTVTLMPLKFLDRRGRGTTADAIAAILYAASFEDGFGNKIVRITNNSWGGGSPSEALETAIAGSGALFVASAGNSGRTSKMYPAGFDSDNIISVAATDHNDELAGFSNRSSSWVDLGAPGVDVLSTVRRNKYRLFSGTSMAAPHVAGVAGLVMAKFPELSNETVKARILATVDPLLSLEGKTLTGGRLNALNAVGNPDLIPPDPVIDLAVDLAATTFDSIKLTWTATGEDGTTGTATLYDVRYSTSPISNDADFDGATQAEGEPPPQPSGSPESFTVTGLSGDTTYSLALKVADEVGNVSALSNVVSETTPPSEWSIEIVDSGSGTFIVGEVALAYDPIGNPAIAYRDSTNDQVKFAHFNGSSWDVETVAAGRSVDLAYDPLTAEPTISYRLGPDASVMFARFDGSSWDIQLVTDKSSRLGMETSLAYDSIGNPSISYHLSHGRGRGLKLARFNDLTQQWDIEVVGPGIHVPFNSLAYGLDGNPSIAYIDHHTHPGVLKIARFNGASWDIEIVDSRDPYRGVSLAYDPVSGDPAIAYNIRPGEENVRIPTFARWNGTTWEIEAVDSVGSETSLAYDSSGVPFISIKASTQIKVAQRSGTVWEIEIVENVAVAGQTSLAFDQLGNPSVSYYDTDNDVLKFARKVGP